MNPNILSDFPKIECPFVRKIYKVNKDDHKKHGRRLHLRTPEVYIVINEVNPGYEWVFEDSDTIAVEKLNGTNVKLKTIEGRLTHLQNRKNIIDPLQIIKGKTFIVEGVLRSVHRDMINFNGEQCGEVIGPKLQGNPYNINEHIWYPFEKTIGSLRYKSFDNYDRTLENWSSWFRDYLISLFYCNHHKILHKDCKVMAEGIIFYNLKRKNEGKSYMAKLRRDMFSWFYNPYLEIFYD